MRVKIGNMNCRNIINRFFIVGVIYFIPIMFNMIITNITLPIQSTTFDYILNIFEKIYSVSIPIILFILFELLCEILYKVLRVCELIIENNNNKV